MLALVERLESRRLLAATTTALTHQPPSSISEMILLSDGRVLAQEGGSANWAILTPDSTGSYINGTWSTASNMHDTRTYYSTQVLEDGRVFVAGGEYGTGGAKVEIYNPVTNTWTQETGGVGTFEDASSEILPNGNVLDTPVYPATSGYSYIYNPTTNAWSLGGKYANGGSDADEQNFVKLADNSILAPDGTYTSQRYIPASNTWVADANGPNAFTDSLGEYGTGVLLPNGKVLYVGTGSYTEIYTPSGSTSPGTWVNGPALPTGDGQDDAPAAVLPDGNVLFAVGPIDSYNGPTTYEIYNYQTNTLSAATSIPTNTSVPYGTRFLDLPDGTVMVDGQSNGKVEIYNDGGTAVSGAQPTISSITHNTDGSYLLTGTQLNGNSEGAYYGDDAQMNSNYPIVRLTSSGGAVYFARSYNWNNTGVQTGSTVVTTDFALPSGLPAGTYTVNVMVNGLISAATTITTPAVTGDAAPTVAKAASASPSPTTSTSTTLSVLGADDAGESNLTYTWANTSAPSGAPTASLSVNGTNASKTTTATFQKAGSYTFKVTITDASGLSTTSSVTVTVNQTLTSIALSPASPNLTSGQTQQFSAIAYDQFGIAMTTQPTFTWTLTSGGGTLSTTGLYTTPSTGTLAAVSAASGSVSASTNVYVVSAPWTSADVGSPALSGSAYDSSGTFTVTGGGSDVYGTSDQFHYVYQQLTGNLTIEARVVSEPNSTSTSEKAGVMIRSTLDAASPQADMFIEPTGGAFFQDRTTSGGSSVSASTSGPTPPYYVKLVRAGSTITGYYSSNGSTWTKESSATISMTDPVYVGFFVCSHNASSLATVTFDHVGVFGTAPDSLSVSPGSTASVNVLANDSTFSGTTLSVTGVTQGTKGSVTYNANGTVTYTANANAVGNDSFTYTASDGVGDTATGTVNVSILGLQAYYRMNEGTGTTTADATGDGFTATLSGATWSTGVDGSNGLAFSGTSSYATAPAFGFTSNTVTLSGWIDRTSTEPTSAGIIFNRNGSNGNGLDFYNTTTLGYTWGTNASTYNFNSGLTPALNTWTFVALVITASNATIYMQPLGGSLSSATQTLSLPAETFSTITGLGEDPSYTTRDFVGSMDEVRVYNTALSASSIASIANLNPTVATAAAASPSPVTGKTTNLSVLGADYAGESVLNYTWAATTVPSGAAAPTYSANGSNAAKNTTATFSKAGSYVFTVTIADGAGLSTTSNVAVTVSQTLTTLSVTPVGPTNVQTGASQQFMAYGTDQFGAAMTPAVSWSVDSGSVGNVSSSGLYSAGTTAGTATVRATTGSLTATAAVNVLAAPTVSTFVVNDGSAQRSMVQSLTLTFSEPVTLASNAITLTERGNSTAVDFALTPSSDRTTYVLTFTDSSYINGSLPDGVYDLTFAAGSATNAAGGTNTAQSTYSFFRLFGDANGDGTVNSGDNFQFRSAFGSSSGDSNYLAYFDYDGNGTINSGDNFQFRSRFGMSLSV